MTHQTIGVEIAEDGVATVTLERPEVHNAFNEVVISELTGALLALGANPRVRLVVLRGRGKSFSAGADLGWMQRLAAQTDVENLSDAWRLAELMHTLDRLPKPTLAVVQGAAIAGGVGLVACCDIAVAAERASFCLSEVRLGLIPSVISPYVMAAMGERACRRYFLTAELFSAAEALRLGLVHVVVPHEVLEDKVAELIGHLRAGAPQAQAAAKALVFDVGRRPSDETVRMATAEAIARRRASEEGRQGMAAFLTKRQPPWVG